MKLFLQKRVVAPFFFLVFTGILFGFGAKRVSAADFNPKNIEKRDNFQNCRVVFEKTKKDHVAFLGGSITEMDGYRPMVTDWLAKRFPETEFTFTAAGISSTCSTTGAFRLASDVLAAGPVDLFFVEFAVNDNQDGFFSETTARRGMEGVIRQLRQNNPKADIVMTFFVNEALMAACREGKDAVSVAAHRKVADYYGVSTIDLAREITEEIDAGKITWQEFGGVHPAPRGNAICAAMIESLLDSDWNETLAAGERTNLPKSRPLPEPLDRFSYFNAGFISPERGVIGDQREQRPVETERNIDRGASPSAERGAIDSGWTWAIPDWPKIPGGFRSQFGGKPLLCADKPGAVCRLAFSGSVVGAYLLAGPDAGILEYSIDGGEKKTVDLWHPYSVGLHYPRTVLFADELSDGRHEIEITVSPEKNEKSTGHAARILQFCGGQ